MKIKPKSCSCNACKAIKNKKSMKKILQKSFRASVKRSTRNAYFNEEYKEFKPDKLSYYWA